jgi:hypothetical protein
MKQFTKQQVLELINKEHHDVVLRWLARGDGIGVYENHDLGHPDIGHKQFVSFGSAAAQLETDDPPTRLPDIGGRINWRYSLVGTHRDKVEGDPCDILAVQRQDKPSLAEEESPE